MPDRTLRIGLVQTAVSQDLDRNLSRTVRGVRSALEQGARVICLQELFCIPYFPQEERGFAEPYAESVPGPTTDLFSQLAAEHQVVMIVPIFERAGTGQYYNTAVVIGTDGSLFPPYRKIHIPHDPLFYEKSYFRPGDQYRVYETEYGRFGVLICYDQWFPEAARAVTLQGADLLFFPTAIGRIQGEEAGEGDWQIAWETVQRGHAIANGVHVAAVNRVGREGKLHFWGGSFVCDAFGTILGKANEEEGVLVVDVDLSMNQAVREGWGFLRNRRPDTYQILLEDGLFGARSVASRSDTPRKRGFEMPAEWEPHEATWLAWPHNRDTFSCLEEVEEAYRAILCALHGKERICLLVRDQQMEARIQEILKRLSIPGDQVSLFPTEYADVWIRDYGPTFVVNRSESCLGMVSWQFNAWGEKYTELMKDNRIPDVLAGYLPIPRFETGIVLEGGSIEVNGRGTVMTTEQCLLNPNRNPCLSRGEIERYLQEYLGVEAVLWLNQGIVGDDTDGHIDDIARFANPETILCALEENRTDENYRTLQENYRILQAARDRGGRAFTVIPVPMPAPIEDEGRLPASYLNFYIGNETVLVPFFGDRNDGKAHAIFKNVFPGREIVGIDCRAMVKGLGAIHCISQQQPRV